MTEKVAFDSKLATEDYSRRINDLVTSGRVSEAHAAKILTPTLECLQLSLHEDGEPVKRLLDTILEILESLPESKNLLTARPQTSKSAIQQEQNIPLIQKRGALDEFLSSGNDLSNKTMVQREPICKRGRDERRSHRHVVPQARQPCEVKIGANVLSASLLNESESGFAVLVNRLDGLKIGQKVQLYTKPKWITVRVVHIEQVARPKDASPSNRECDHWFRLGMKK
jgi:hypothetical protein